MVLSIFIDSARPFSVINEEWYRFFIKPQLDFFNININRKNVQNMIHELAAEKRNEISAELFEIPIALEFDGVS